MKNTELISAIEADHSNGTISHRELLRETLISLYRFNSWELTSSLVRNEIFRTADKLIRQRRDIPCEFKTNPTVSCNLHNTFITALSSDLAQPIHESLHYLRSFRKDGIHLGLFMRGASVGRHHLLATVTLSPFDLDHVMAVLPFNLNREEMLVLSRLYAFDWSPQNTISYTLARVREWLKAKLPYVRLLITYSNPNLDFTGTVYKASNWSLIGREHKTRYLYLDSDYVTDRHMIRDHGTADINKLKARLGERISQSKHPLVPLELYAYALDNRIRLERTVEHELDIKPPNHLVGD